MKKYGAWPALFLAGVLAAGCGVYNYRVRVNGYTEPAAPAIHPGSSFFVIANKDAKNPLLEREVQEKIEKLLQRQGYQPAPYEKAEYYLLFSYGLGGEAGATVVMPDYDTYAGFGIGTGYWGRYASIFVGPYFSFPLSGEAVALYDRWLLIKVVDGNYYRDQGQFRTVWVGEARSTGASSDLRTILNYLLVADFKEFGKNTGKAVTLEISEPEPGVFGLAPPK